METLFEANTAQIVKQIDGVLVDMAVHKNWENAPKDIASYMGFKKTGPLREWCASEKIAPILAGYIRDRKNHFGLAKEKQMNTDRLLRVTKDRTHRDDLRADTPIVIGGSIGANQVGLLRTAQVIVHCIMAAPEQFPLSSEDEFHIDDVSKGWCLLRLWWKSKEVVQERDQLATSAAISRHTI